MIRLLVLLLLVATSARADDLSAFAFTQRQGAALPLDARVTDERGLQAPLETFLAHTPAILALGYFHCPNLCGVTREDLFSALSRTGLTTPRDYTVLAISIDPNERATDAASAKAGVLDSYPTKGAAEGWHFLTADAPAIDRIERAVGFHARYDLSAKQFLHPTGLVFATGSGNVSGYLLGVGYAPGDVAAAVTRAAQGHEAAALPVLLLCFHFDPATGRYTPDILKLVQLGGGITVLVIGGLLVLLRRPL